MNISMKLWFTNTWEFSLIFKTHLYPLQVENYDSNLRFVADEDDNGKFRLERVNLFGLERAKIVFIMT